MKTKLMLISFLITLILTPSVLADSFFPIGDGTVVSEGWQYTHYEPESNPYSIETAINVSITESITITSKSDTIVQFEYDLYFSVDEAYQKLSGQTYTAVSYGLRFYDEEMELIDTGASSYEILRQVQKFTGIRTLSQVPYGASYVVMAAYFGDPSVFEWLSTWPPWPLEGHGTTTTVYLVNSSTLSIGDTPHPNYTISGIGEYQGYETWIAQPKEIPTGFTTFTDYHQFEKNSGLWLKQDASASLTGAFDFEYHLRATQFADVIMTLPTAAGIDPIILVGVSAAGVVLIVIVVFIAKKRAS